MQNLESLAAEIADFIGKNDQGETLAYSPVPTAKLREWSAALRSQQPAEQSELTTLRTLYSSQSSTAEDAAKDWDELPGFVSPSERECFVALVSRTVAKATAELQAKCERLESQLAGIIARPVTFHRCNGSIRPYPQFICSSHRGSGPFPDFDALKELTALQSQLAAKGEEKPLALPENFQLLDPQKNYVVDAIGAAKAMRFNGVFDENHALHLQLEASKASPSPARPTGEDGRRLAEYDKLFPWLYDWAMIWHKQSGGYTASDTDIGLMKCDRLAADARRIVGGGK